MTLELDKWKAACGLWGVDGEARGLATIEMDQAPTARDLLGSTPMHEILPYVAITAWSLGHTRAKTMLAAELDVVVENVVLSDPRVRAVMASLSASELGPVAGRRHLWTSPSHFSEWIAKHTQASEWIDPSPLRILPYVRVKPSDPRSLRWDDVSQLTTRLICVCEESQSEDGYHTLTQRWYLPEDVSLGMVVREGAPVIVEYVKVYIDGLIGPVSRADAASLFRLDGTALEWAIKPKVYDFGQSRRLAVKRRVHVVEWLQGLIAYGLSSGQKNVGQDVLEMFDTLTKAFESSGKGNEFVAALDAGILALQSDNTTKAIGDKMSATMPVIRTRLAPWLTI